MGLGSTWSKLFRVMTNASGQHMISSDGLKAALKTTANHVSSLTENPLTDPDLQPGARAEARTFFKSLLADEYNVKAMPVPKDKYAVCLMCGLRLGVNSAQLKIHIASKCVVDHPQKSDFMVDIAGSKTAHNRLGKRANADLVSAKVKDEHDEGVRPGKLRGLT